MKLMKAQKVLNNRLQQEFLAEPELWFNRQEMSALGLPNLVGKSYHILEAHSQLNSSASPNFIIFNILRTQPPLDIAHASNNHFFSTLINDNLLHSEIHPMLTSVMLILISFNVASIMTSAMCQAIPPVLFRTAGLGPPLLFLNLFSLSMSHANFPSQRRTSIIAPQHKKCTLQDTENFRHLSHAKIPHELMKKLLKSNI